MPLSASDHEQIRQLLARYSQALDFADTDGFVACFTADGVLDTSDPEPDLAGTHHGQDALRAYVSAASRYTAGHVRHSALNLLVEGDGDTAAVSSYVVVTEDYGPPIVEGQVTYAVLATTGMWFDELARTADGWRITRREFRHDGLPDVLARVGRPVTVGPGSPEPHGTPDA